MSKSGSLVLLALACFALDSCGSDVAYELEPGEGIPGDGLDDALADGGGASDGGIVQLSEAESKELESGACAERRLEGDLVAPVVEFVVDVSSSMGDPAPGGGGATKWGATRVALGDAIDMMQDDARVGILFYPNFEAFDGLSAGTVPREASACVNVDAMVGIAPLGASGSPQRQAIDEMIQGVSYTVGTPTFDAYHYALTQALIPFDSAAEKYMVLITDGMPTYTGQCMGGPSSGVDADSQPIVDDIGNAFATYGIRTFLVGSPGSESERPWLSRAAVLGGTELEGCSVAGPTNWCHLDMTEAQDFGHALADGLRSVATQVASCSLGLPEGTVGRVADPYSGALVLKDASGATFMVFRDNVGGCSEGWNFDERGRIVLCPDTCARVQSNPSLQAAMYFDCAATGVPAAR